MKVDISNLGPVESGIDLRPEDIIIHKFKRNYGNGDKSPLDNILFYKSSTNPSMFFNLLTLIGPDKLSQSQVSMLFPQVFEEICLRIFVKDSEKAEIAQKATNIYVKQLTIDINECSNFDNSFPLS